MEDSFFIHPNPVESKMNLTIKNPKNLKAKIELLDINGRIVKLLFDDLLKESIQLDLDDIASGFYLLHIDTIEDTRTIKIIKK